MEYNYEYRERQIEIGSREKDTVVIARKVEERVSVHIEFQLNVTASGDHSSVTRATCAGFTIHQMRYGTFKVLVN